MRCLTVTCNSAVDTTHVLDRIAVGAINRVDRVLPTPGGKGNNVARVLRTLGHEVVATGFAGGHTGRFITDALTALGIEPAFVPVPGDSRVCLTVVEASTGRITEIREPGPVITAEDGRRLIERVVALAPTVDAVSISGSLPPGLPPGYYAELIAAVRATGVFVAFDSGGAPLRAGLLGRPDLVKPNAEELADLLGVPGAGAPGPGLPGPGGLDLAVARRGLAELGLGDDAAVLLSLGADGAALITGTDIVSAVPPPVTVANTVGSGDALLAGFLDGRSRGESPTDALARAVAVGTAAALRDEVGVVAQDDVTRLQPDVRLVPHAEVRAA